MKDRLISISTSESVYREANKFMAQNPSGKYRLTIAPDNKKRSIPANNQQHLWYGQIAEQQGDRTSLDVKNFCKDAFGLPLILNSEKHGDRMEFLLDKLDYYKHSYESKMKLIQCLEVTSLLNTAESKIYMEQMIFYYNDNGINIKFKD